MATNPRLSRVRRPRDLPPEDCQRTLRRQFGREQHFLIENLGDAPVFSEFPVTNPESRRSYRVAIRGIEPGSNYCACPDFTTNDLGTCKHIEFTLSRIEAKRGGKAALKRGFRPPFSELFLDYGSPRCVRLRLGADCPPAIARRAKGLFDQAQNWQLSADRFALLPPFLDAVRRSGHDIRCYDDALAFIAEHRDAQTRCRVIDEIYPMGADSPALKKLLKIKLYRYQLQGPCSQSVPGGH